MLPNNDVSDIGTGCAIALKGPAIDREGCTRRGRFWPDNDRLIAGRSPIAGDTETISYLQPWTRGSHEHSSTLLLSTTLFAQDRENVVHPETNRIVSPWS